MKLTRRRGPSQKGHQSTVLRISLPTNLYVELFEMAEKERRSVGNMFSVLAEEALLVRLNGRKKSS